MKSALKQIASALAAVKNAVEVTPCMDLNRRIAIQQSLFKIWATALLSTHSVSVKELCGDLPEDFVVSQLDAPLAALKKQLVGNHPSLCAFHLRSPNIPSGRLSVAMDSLTARTLSPVKLTSSQYHDALLRVYFEVYGRARTFNELVFDRIANGGVSNFTFVFSSSGKDFLKVDDGQNLVQVTICRELRETLLPDDLRRRFLRVNRAASLLGQDGKPEEHWHTSLCSEGIIESLAECVENAYCRFGIEAFPKWKSLFNVLYPDGKVDGQNWNRAKREILREALKSLQGTCLYQGFATESLTTIAQCFDPNILGVTVGFATGGNQGLVSALEDKLGTIHSQTVLAFGAGTDQQSTVGTDDDVWTQAKEGIFAEHNALVFRLRDLAHKLQPLRFAVHEGHPLCFTVYVGKQTVLSRFRYFHEFNATGEPAALDKHLANALKAHYSLFLDGITGVYCDESSKTHFGLVKPLRLRAGSQVSIQARNLDDNDLERATLETREFFSSLSTQTSGLAVLHVSPGRMEIFFDGKLVLQSSEETDFHWRYVAAATDQWQNNDLTKLLNNLLRKHEFKNLTCNNLAAAIQRVSDAKGQGGLLVIDTACSPPGHVLSGMKSRLNPSKLSVWDGGRLFDYSVDGLVQLIIPDGATLICAKSYGVENQVQVIPINQTKKGGVAVDLADREPGKFDTKGTKHRTAKAITDVRKSATAICISADGPITVFQNGATFLPSALRA